MIIAILILTIINFIMLIILGWHILPAHELHQRLSGIELKLDELKNK